MRNESLYNLAQENEVLVFLNYLPKAVIRVARDKTLWKGEGRPPKDLYDILVCLMIQHYIGFSTRRSMGIIKVFTSFARMHVEMPCFKTLSNYRNKEELKTYLDSLIEETSKPLSLLENDFSTDATGASTKTFSSWYSIRAKKRSRRRDHIMTHVTTSRILNSAVAVDTGCRKGKDSIYMREHINQVKKNFRINDWCGDGAYCSRDNCEAVRKVNGNPWFKPRKNSVLKKRGCKAYNDMLLAYVIEHEKSLKHYHKRSNSESTFSAKKRKFGNVVRSRNNTAKENEEHSKWIAYNFPVLARAKFEHGIKAFEKD